MSEAMDKLVTINPDSMFEPVSKISKEKFLALKNKHGYVKAYTQLGRELAIDIGLHPLKEIVPIEFYSTQMYESYEEEFAIIFAFSYKKGYYVYSESG